MTDHSNDIKLIREDIKDIKKDVRMLLENKWVLEGRSKTYSKLWGAVSGGVISIAVGLISFYLRSKIQ